MKTFSLLLVAAAALSACSKPQPQVVDMNPDPLANTLKNAPPVELPPAIAADKTFRCKDNSLVAVTFFQGDKQAVVKAPADASAVTLKAPAAGEPYVADGGWKLTGDQQAVTVTTPGKPALSCHV